jgi:DNA uptake protein ComE-like DNA-binding protein
MTASRPHRRGLALIAVLLIMGATVLVATSLLFVAQAEYAGSARTDDTVQARALAWSGVQAAMVRLDEQHQDILDGSVPELDEAQFIVYETATRLGVVRLLPVGPAGEHLVPEAGKLDVNGIDAEILAATELIEPGLADAVIGYRDRTLGRPFQSVGELLRVEGLSVETLYGPVEQFWSADESEQDGDVFPAAVQSGAPIELRGLADAVTVYSFEPAIQRNGALRINLNVPWSDELGDRIADRFGTDVAQTVQRIMEAGDFHYGRLDINTAPYEALVALPGLEAEQAQEIVEVRDELDPDERSTVAWPAIQGIVEPEAYDQLAGRITTRCWTWRLRLAAGEVDAEDVEAPLVNPIVYEVVIDLSAPRPRVAFLRDITWMGATALIAGAVDSGRDDAWEQQEEAQAGVEGEAPAADEAEPPDEEYADADDLGLGAAPDGGLDGGDSGDMPGAEQPGGSEAVSLGGAGDTAADAPSSQSAAPVRSRIGRWTAG